MTQDEKELLLKDTCARIPYNIKCTYYDKCVGEEDEGTITGMQNETYFVIDGGCIDVENVKPYLFPLSNLKEDLKQEYTYIVNYINSDDTNNWKEGEFIYVEQFTQLMHFYHKHHIDYRGLIPMGLAIDASNLNIY